VYICFEFGFVSVSRSKDEPEKFQIRARDAVTLYKLEKRVFDGEHPLQFVATDNAGYPARLICTADELVDVLESEARRIEYHDVKGAVRDYRDESPERAFFELFCSRVWSLARRMLDQRHALDYHLAARDEVPPKEAARQAAEYEPAGIPAKDAEIVVEADDGWGGGPDPADD